MNATNTPTVSVIIVNWNTSAYLKQCLTSLTPQACRYPLEIIVVDNASTDDSVAMVSACFPAVRLIRNTENLGFAKANNLGAIHSYGQYLCFINSDVKVLDDCITRLVDYCIENPDTGIAGPQILGGNLATQRSCRGFPGLWNMFCRALALDSLFPKVKLFTGYSLTHWPQKDFRNVDILSGCFWLARRSAVCQIGLLDENFFMYGEDMDWCKRFRAAGWRLVFVPTAKAIHYGGASSSKDPTRFYIEMQRANLQYWRKHNSRSVTACYFMISCLHMLTRTIGYSIALVFKSETRTLYRAKITRSLACLKYLFTGHPLTPSQLARQLPGKACGT